MPRFIVDLWMDGYDTEEEMIEACEEYIYDQLNFTASSVKIERIEGGTTDGRLICHFYHWNTTYHKGEGLSYNTLIHTRHL